MANIRHFRELEVYILAFQSAMRIFELSKPFQAKKSIPSQIKFVALLGQFAQTSRKGGANVVIQMLFISKLTDADAEAGETQVWLDFAVRCGYLEEKLATELDQAYNSIQGKLINMLTRRGQWQIKGKREAEKD